MRVIQLYNSHQLLRRTYKWRGGLLLLRGALAVCATSMDSVITTSTTPTSTPQKKGARGGGAQVTPKKSPARPAAPAPVTPALQRKAARISAQLDALYGSPPVPLTHGSAFQLLVAVVLSAQTTDKKVNEVTPELFGLAPDAHALAQMDVASIQSIIAPIGLAPTKARNLSGMAKVCGTSNSNCLTSVVLHCVDHHRTTRKLPCSCCWSGMVVRYQAHLRSWRRCRALDTRQPVWSWARHLGAHVR